MKGGEHRAAFLTARWTLIATTVCDWLFSPKVSNTVPDFHVNKQDQCEQWPQKGTVKAGSNCWMCTCAWLLKAVHRNAYQGNSHLGEGDANKSPLESVIHEQRDWSASFFDCFPQHPNSTGQSFSCNIFLHMVHAQYESLRGLFSRMAASHIFGTNSY